MFYNFGSKFTKEILRFAVNNQDIKKGLMCLNIFGFFSFRVQLQVFVTTTLDRQGCGVERHSFSTLPLSLFFAFLLNDFFLRFASCKYLNVLLGSESSAYLVLSFVLVNLVVKLWLLKFFSKMSL